MRTLRGLYRRDSWVDLGAYTQNGAEWSLNGEPGLVREYRGLTVNLREDEIEVLLEAASVYRFGVNHVAKSA